jgi:hypothetical protein
METEVNDSVFANWVRGLGAGDSALLCAVHNIVVVSGEYGYGDESHRDRLIEIEKQYGDEAAMALVELMANMHDKSPFERDALWQDKAYHYIACVFTVLMHVSRLRQTIEEMAAATEDIILRRLSPEVREELAAGVKPLV